MARKSRPAKQEFFPKNTAKYIGKYPIIYRSSWENTLMRVFDDNPGVLSWASEPISIPYRNPLNGQWTVYIPDFLVVYVDRNGKNHAEIIEVKPAKEHFLYEKGAKEKISERTKLTQIINAAKWEQAAKYCHKNGLYFRVMTEKEMFAWQKPKK